MLFVLQDFLVGYKISSPLSEALSFLVNPLTNYLAVKGGQQTQKT